MKTLLIEEARKNKTEYIGPVYEDNLGLNSEKNLLNLSDPVGVLLQFVLSSPFSPSASMLMSSIV